MIRVRWRLLAASLISLASTPTTMAQQRSMQLTQPGTEIIPPDASLGVAVPGTATLRPGPMSQTLRSVTIRQRHRIDALRSRPVIALGNGRVDLRPVFMNPSTLTNVAASLRKSPRLAKVTADSLEVLEIEQGLILQQHLSYQLSLGACSSARQRQQVQQGGVDCFTRLPAAQRRAAFSDPASARFVADPRERRRVIDAAEKATAASEARIAGHLAEFRRQLADPARRREFIRTIGRSEVQRLAAMKDEDLAAELINAAKVQIEQTMFVPAQTAFTEWLPPGTGSLSVRDPSASQPASTAIFTRRPSPIAALRPEAIRVPRTYQLEARLYLTGFTLANRYEWRERVSVTIDWCLFGCSETYYLEAFAGFHFGMGLRRPLLLRGTWTHVRQGRMEYAQLKPEFITVDADASQYREAGVTDDRLFNGQELVAELGATAGFAYKVPFLGSDQITFDPGVDFTGYLPPPLTGGQFTPPGAAQALSVPVVLEHVDLLGERANFGVAGARVMPAVKIDLISRKITFKLRDQVANTTLVIDQSGASFRLAVDAKDSSSRFTLGDPVYQLGFALTPGITADLFVDVSVWSRHWKLPVWFPELSVELPPGGVEFGCHTDTICSRGYHFTYSAGGRETGRAQSTTASNPWESQVRKWSEGLLKKGTTRCTTRDRNIGAFCRTGIMATVREAENQMQWLIDDSLEKRQAARGSKARNAVDKQLQSQLDGKKSDAEARVQQIVNETTAAATRKKPMLSPGPLPASLAPLPAN